jgi:hypothetical protein
MRGEPKTLREKHKQQEQRRDLRHTNSLADTRNGHELLL